MPLEGFLMRTRLVAMTLGLLVGTAPFLLAHHSFSAEYDAQPAGEGHRCRHQGGLDRIRTSGSSWT